jgi:uncharacterized membrane protein YfcA
MKTEDMAAALLGGCTLIFVVLALLNLTLVPLMLHIAWNMCIIGVLAPIFGWTLPALGYVPLVAAGISLTILGGFFGKMPQIQTPAK